MQMKKVIDPRGDGPIEQLEIMEGGQPNIIDYSNQEPLLYGAGENSSHEYPGKIVVNNEPERGSQNNDFNKYGTTNQSGEGSVGADRTQPTLPTGAPGLYEIDHNAHGLNFNSKIVWNEVDEYEIDETVSIPGTAVEKSVGTDCKQCQRKSNEEYIEEYEMQEHHLMEAFVEGDHPRAPPGSSKGGQFVSKDGNQDGGEYSRQQLKVTTTVQGMQVAVHPAQKKLWEQHTTEEQRNDPNHKVQYGQELIDKAKAAGAEPAAAEPKSEPKAEPEPEPTTPGPTEDPRDIYKNLPEDTEKPGEGLKKRKALFEDYEERNGHLYNLRSTIEAQERQIKYQQDYLASDKGKALNDAQRKFREENIDSLEDSLNKIKPEADALEKELKAAGKLEYEEVQKYLHSRQSYVEDLKRRKQGSMAWYKAQGQIFAHDRVIDQYRTGKEEGHFPGDDMEQFKARQAAARDAAYADIRKEREKKNAEKFAKYKDENAAAIERLKAKGFDVNPETGKFREPPDEKKFGFPENRPVPGVDTIKDHQQYLKDYKSAIENQVDMATLRVNMDAMTGYVSPYDKKNLKAAKWKLDNFVENHSMVGVVMYNDGDPGQAAIYEQKFNDAPALGRNNVKTISIHKGIGPGKVLTGNKRSVTMGQWDKQGGINLYFASKKFRDKLKDRGLTKDDFDLTADHEFGHSTWQGTKEYIENTGSEIPLAKARDEFSKSVKSAYDDPTFTIHEYTDSYSRGTASFGRGPDILENEAHSKLREFEADGSLDKLESSANIVVAWRDDIAKRPEADQRLRDKYGDMNGLARSQGFKDEAHALNYQKVITNYKKLREEMYKIG